MAQTIEVEGQKVVIADQARTATTSESNLVVLFLDEVAYGFTPENAARIAKQLTAHAAMFSKPGTTPQ